MDNFIKILQHERQRAQLSCAAAEGLRMNGLSPMGEKLHTECAERLEGIDAIIAGAAELSDNPVEFKESCQC